MLLRRIVASLVMLLFILFSTVMFVVAALSQTILQPSFYQGKVMEKAYSAFIDLVAQRLYESDTLISTSFNTNDLQLELKNAFPQKDFELLTQEIIKNLSNPESAEKPLTFSLQPFRETITQLSNPMAVKLFQAIPVCTENQIPTEKNGLPSCLNQTTTQDVSLVIQERLKKDLTGSIPEQLSLDLSSARNQQNSLILFAFKSISNIKYLLYCVLLTLLVAIALIIFKPFTEVVLYVGLAFGLSGIFGYFSGFFLESASQTVLQKSSFFVEQNALADFMASLFSYVTAEMQKTALIFLAFGALLILIQVFIKKR